MSYTPATSVMPPRPPPAPLPRRRLLALVPNSRYINPSEEVFLAALAKQFDVIFHGPGWVSHEALVSDARRLYERDGPFDAVLMHQYHYLNSVAAVATECVFPFNVAEFLAAYPDFAKGYAELPCPSIVMLTRMDYYAVDAALRDRLEQHPGYYLTWPAEFVPLRSTLPDLHEEAFGAAVHDDYHHFAAQARARIIPFMHVLDRAEFLSPTAQPKQDHILVPGQPYKGRQAALRALRAKGLRAPNPRPWLPLASRILKKLTGRGLHGRNWGLDLLQQRFKGDIAGARICVTDGSRLRWPVRKFFEIPAWGSLLLAEPFAEAERLGFRDGETFVAVDSGNLAEKAAYYLAHVSDYNAIVAQSQDMVMRHHTADVRVRQFGTCLEAILANRFAGAEYQNGALHCLQADVAA